MPSAAATCCARSATSPSLREGGLRPGRAEGGLGRPGLRHGLPRPRRRREEGARDLVPVPALQRRRGARDGPGQRASCRTSSSTPRSQQWCDEICEKSPTALAHRQALVQHGHRAPGRHRRHGHVRAQAVLRHRGVARRRQGVAGEAQARLPQVRQSEAAADGAQYAANPYLDDDLVSARRPCAPLRRPSASRPASWSATRPACSTAG